MGARRDRPKPLHPGPPLADLVPGTVEPGNPFARTGELSANVIARTKNTFIWTSKKRLAAQMLAQGDLLDSEIAAQLGVERHLLTRWRLHPTFLLGIKQFADGLTAELAEQGVTIKKRRLEDYDRIDMLLNQIREERAAAAVVAIETDPELGAVGGFRTGLIIKQDKVIGTGSNAQRTTEYKIDSSWLDAKLALHKQVAQETGQWTVQTHVTGEIGVKMTVDDIRAAIFAPSTDADYRELPDPTQGALHDGS